MTTAAPPSRRFTDLVRAEGLPTRFVWHTRDTIAVLAIPAVFAADLLARMLSGDPEIVASIDVALRILIFVVLIITNGELLARHWKAFWAAKWRSTGLVVVGLVVVQSVVSVLSALLRPLAEDVPETAARASVDPNTALLLLLFLSLGPTVTALIEDFVFRHTLLLKLPVWSSKVTAVLVIVVNALVFGAIHYDNFGGQLLLTLSYAGAGLVMNLVYLWTRNIWHVLLMRGLNNFILGGPLTVLLGVLLSNLLGAAVGPGD